EHVKVMADGTPLQGEVTHVTPPETTALEGRIGYEIRFPFPAQMRRPAKIAVGEDVLNELEFAPGNRWEATYVVRVREENSEMHEGLLLTAREPLVYQC